jgi:hypothetical protein
MAKGARHGRVFFKIFGSDSRRQNIREPGELAKQKRTRKQKDEGVHLVS